MEKVSDLNETVDNLKRNELKWKKVWFIIKCNLLDSFLENELKIEILAKFQCFLVKIEVKNEKNK